MTARRDRLWDGIVIGATAMTAVNVGVRFVQIRQLTAEHRLDMRAMSETAKRMADESADRIKRQIEAGIVVGTEIEVTYPKWAME